MMRHYFDGGKNSYGTEPKQDLSRNFWASKSCQNPKFIYRISPNKRPGAYSFRGPNLLSIFLKKTENNIKVDSNGSQRQFTYSYCINSFKLHFSYQLMGIDF